MVPIQMDIMNQTWSNPAALLIFLGNTNWSMGFEGSITIPVLGNTIVWCTGSVCGDSYHQWYCSTTTTTTKLPKFQSSRSSQTDLGINSWAPKFEKSSAMLSNVKHNKPPKFRPSICVATPRAWPTPPREDLFRLAGAERKNPFVPVFQVPSCVNHEPNIRSSQLWIGKPWSTHFLRDLC